MYLESEHFIVDKVKYTDKDNLKLLEDSRPWAKIIKEAQNVISDKDKSDYFEELWEHYQSKKYFWCIYRRDAQFCGVIQLDNKNSNMDTVTKDESTENLDIRQILDIKELQRIQDLFLTVTGMTAAVVDMKGKYITRGNSFTSFYSRYTNGKHNELREFTQDLTVGGFRAGTVIGGIVLGDYPDDSAPSQEVVSAGGQLLAEMLNLWANALYYRKSNADSVEAFAKEEKKVRDAVGQIKYKAKGLEQTATMEKMLSLNAAIEAGRAGKAGVGFGVVADEIGRMANESAAVYQEIQELVKQVEESMERLGE